MRTAGIISLLVAVCWSPSQGLAQDAGSILRDLDSPNYQTQRKAVQAAQKIQSGPILDKLLHLAAQASHANILGYACEALGHYRDPRIFAVLETVAVKKPRGWYPALIGLGLLGDSRSFAILVKAIEGPENRHVPRWSYAAEGLRHLGDKRAGAILAKMVRANVHDSKVYGEVPRAIFVLDQDLALELFFEVLQDERVYEHHGLHRYLSKVKTKAVRGQAIALLDHKSEAVQLHAIHILGHTADTGTISTLLTIMEQAKTGSRRQEAAINALGTSGHELAVPQLARHLGSENAAHRAAVAQALGKIGHVTATRSLVVALRKEEEIIPKLRLVEALGRVGDRRAITTLGDYLEDTTMLEQPETISMMWIFPYNTPVNHSAWWSIQKIRSGGKEPCDLSRLLAPKWGGRAVTKDKIEDAAKWWREQHGKSGFHLGK
jgi:HEAT repeat protein